MITIEAPSWDWNAILAYLNQMDIPENFTELHDLKTRISEAVI